MEKQFVTYEIALKLKELGFDESCFGYYTPMKDWMMKGKYSDGKLRFHGPNWANVDNSMYFMYIVNSFGDRESTVKNSDFTKSITNVAVPLWQQVIDWFRDEHDIVIEIVRQKYFDTYANSYAYEVACKVYKNKELEGSAVIRDNKNNHIFYSYEEAREQAILKALELCQK